MLLMLLLGSTMLLSCFGGTGSIISAGMLFRGLNFKRIVFIELCVKVLLENLLQGVVSGKLVTESGDFMSPS